MIGIGETIGLVVFCGLVLAFSRFVLKRDLAGWIWEQVREGWRRIVR